MQKSNFRKSAIVTNDEKLSSYSSNALDARFLKRKIDEYLIFFECFMICALLDL